MFFASTTRVQVGIVVALLGMISGCKSRSASNSATLAETPTPPKSELGLILDQVNTPEPDYVAPIREAMARPDEPLMQATSAARVFTPGSHVTAVVKFPLDLNYDPRVEAHYAPANKFAVESPSSTLVDDWRSQIHEAETPSIKLAFLHCPVRFAALRATFEAQLEGKDGGTDGQYFCTDMIGYPATPGLAGTATDGATGDYSGKCEQLVNRLLAGGVVRYCVAADLSGSIVSRKRAQHTLSLGSYETYIYDLLHRQAEFVSQQAQWTQQVSAALKGLAQDRSFTDAENAYSEMLANMPVTPDGAINKEGVINLLTSLATAGFFGSSAPSPISGPYGGTLWTAVNLAVINASGDAMRGKSNAEIANTLGNTMVAVVTTLGSGPYLSDAFKAAGLDPTAEPLASLTSILPVAAGGMSADFFDVLRGRKTIDPNDVNFQEVLHQFMERFTAAAIEFTGYKLAVTAGPLAGVVKQELKIATAEVKAAANYAAFIDHSYKVDVYYNKLIAAKHFAGYFDQGHAQTVYKEYLDSLP